MSKTLRWKPSITMFENRREALCASSHCSADTTIAKSNWKEKRKMVRKPRRGWRHLRKPQANNVLWSLNIGGASFVRRFSERFCQSRVIESGRQVPKTGQLAAKRKPVRLALSWNCSRKSALEESRWVIYRGWGGTEYKMSNNKSQSIFQEPVCSQWAFKADGTRSNWPHHVHGMSLLFAGRWEEACLQTTFDPSKSSGTIWLSQEKNSTCWGSGWNQQTDIRQTLRGHWMKRQ